MRQIEIPRHTHVVRHIRKLIRSGDAPPIVGLRIFGAHRLDTVLSTGTDRDENSSIWGDKNDYKGTRPEHVTRSVITYMRVVDLRNRTPVCIPFVKTHDALDTLKHLVNMKDDTKDCQVVYHPWFLRRVAQGEFWFKKDPLRAVIAVFTIGK